MQIKANDEGGEMKEREREEIKFEGGKGKK
jgi:hypothetical protein